MLAGFLLPEQQQFFNGSDKLHTIRVDCDRNQGIMPPGAGFLTEEMGKFPTIGPLQWSGEQYITSAVLSQVL